MFWKKRTLNSDKVERAIRELKERVSCLEKENQELRLASKSLVQGVGVVRFNPFANFGGNQSFSLAILDAKRDGAVVTGFYSEEGSCVYSKPIKGGESEYSLVDEEKKAILQATKQLKEKSKIWESKK